MSVLSAPSIARRSSRCASPCSSTGKPKVRFSFEILSINLDQAACGALPLQQVCCTLSINGSSRSFQSNGIETIGNGCEHRYSFLVGDGLLDGLATTSSDGSFVHKLLLHAGSYEGEFVGESSSILSVAGPQSVMESSMPITKCKEVVGHMAYRVIRADEGDFASEDGIWLNKPSFSTDSQPPASVASMRSLTVSIQRSCRAMFSPISEEEEEEVGTVDQDWQPPPPEQPSAWRWTHLLPWMLGMFALGVSMGFVPFVMDTRARDSGTTGKAVSQLQPQPALLTAAVHRAWAVVFQFSAEEQAAQHDQAVLTEPAFGTMLLSNKQMVYGQLKALVEDSSDGQCMAWVPGLLAGGQLLLKPCFHADSWWKLVLMDDSVRIQHPASGKCLLIKNLKAAKSAITVQSCRGHHWMLINHHLMEPGLPLSDETELATGLVVKFEGRDKHAVSWTKDLAHLEQGARPLLLTLVVQTVTNVEAGNQSELQHEQWQPEMREFHSIIPIRGNSLVVATPPPAV